MTVDNCKMSIRIGGFETNGNYYDGCAIKTNVRCAGTDEDKKQCPFWNKGDLIDS